MDHISPETVTSLFEHQAETLSNEIAVVSTDKSYTYAELNKRANQVAHHLRTLGVAEESVVAIALPRSPEMIIAILGVLKAGGCYLALDLKYPQQRLDYCIQDSKASFLLTVHENMSKFTSCACKIIDVASKQIENQKSSNGKYDISPDNLAYILYTSGSTGLPKGVIIKHQSLSNYINFASTTYAEPANKRGAILHSSIAFDLTITSLFVPLVRGNTIYIMKEDATIEDLADVINNNTDIQLLKITPSHLKVLKEYVSFNNIQDFTLVVGGEELLRDDIAPWLNVKGVRIFNEYGPTEATVGCVVYHLSKDDLQLPFIPIGYPIPYTRIYLLDKDQCPVPQGAIGEICIAGVGLARGYFNRAELTEEKFIPNPFRTEEERTKGLYKKLYLTGDLGKYLPDGNLIFIGREDHQVKINGYRIELHEIESIIMNHDDVKECHIRSIKVIDSAKIIAYIVPGEFTPSETELKEFIQSKLPSYMVPSFFIFIDRIPLTQNGKIDKNALQLPDFLQSSSAQQSHNECCLPIEQQLKDIWIEVLKTQSLSIDDNFYRIGGDSIISLQLVAKARQRGLHFRVQDLFAYPTIRALTHVISMKGDSERSRAHENFNTAIVPLSPIQLWFFQHKFQNKDHFNQAILLKTIRPVDREILKKAFQITINHHPALQFLFTQDTTGIWHQQFTDLKAHFEMEHVELDVSLEEEVLAAISSYSKKAQKCFHIASGELVKVILFDSIHTKTHHILMVIHHLVVDTVSWRILVENLESSYQKLLDGETIIKLPTSSSYQYWVNSLLTYSASAEMENEIAYWQHVEKNIRPLTEDCHGGLLSNHRIQRLQVALNNEDTFALLQRVNQAYKTQINDILLTALVLAVGDMNEQYHLSFCLEGHGREEDIAPRVDLSHTVGWFTSLFPVNLSIDTPYNLKSAIIQVKETLRAIPKKGIGYGLVHFQNQQTFFHNSVRPNLIFNYLGQWDNTVSDNNVFVFENHLVAECAADENPPFFPIEVNAEVKCDVLSILWSYSLNHFQSNTIEKLAQGFLLRLRQLIKHCTNAAHFGYTPSDFPLACLTQSEIDECFVHIPNIEDIYPLSPMQFGILYHHLCVPESKNYFVQTIFKIKGVIDPHVLQQACIQLSANNPILRTGFIYEGLNEPMQYVVQGVFINLHYENWSHYPEEEHVARLNGFLLADQSNGFNVSSPPLFRVALIQTSDNSFIFCCSQHHILLDGWSSSLLLNELFETYWIIRHSIKNRFISSRPLYRNYIKWQRAKQQEDESARDFWKNYLASLEDVTHLEFKDLVHEAAEERYAQNSIKFSSADASSLIDFAQEHHYTINTIILAAVALTLKSYTPYQELVLGVTVSGRDPELTGVEDMVGLLINTLPLRVNYDPTITVADFLKSLQDTIQQIQKYSYLPLAQVQSLANTDRQIFNTIFVFEKHPIDTSSKDCFTDISIEEFEGIENTEYPLTITTLQGEELEIIFNYQTSLFSRDLINRMLKNILHATHQIIQNYSVAINAIDILTPEEKHQITVAWSGSMAVTPPTNTLSELFEKQTEMTPAHTAVICNGKSLSYQQLNTRANQLAHYLRSKKVTKETFIIIYCVRSLDMMIAILAVLKAGGTYIPIDPNYPQETLSHILEDSSASILLTQKELLSTLLEINAEVIEINTSQIMGFPRENLPVLATRDSLAYIIYTSGSTGKPKGVMVEHGNICARLVGYQDYYALTSKDIVLCQTSTSFDVFLAEVFWPLSIGASIVLSTERGTAHLLELEYLIYKYKVTFAQFVPSVLKLFLMHIDESKTYHLKCICSGGEILEYKLVEECQQKLPHIKLLNAYGPTETTIDTTIFDCSDIGTTKPIFVPVGRSLANSYAYVVNSYMQPVPIGVAGELCIGGASVARGYLNQPDITHKSFLENPFIELLPTNRLYKTGDLCRWLENGNLEYIGRRDNQVKIRGFRVELQEIEEVLLQNSIVKDVVVVVKQDNTGNKQLVAYIVANENLAEVSDIRIWLRNLLPAHMIPNDFVYLDHMPLNANGKTDRKKIALIKSVTSKKEYILPTTPLEQNLCELWKRILNISEIGICDNFFFMGGNSILATQLILTVKKEFQREVSFAAFFNEPTIENLAKLLSNETLSHTEKNVLNHIRKDREAAKRIHPCRASRPSTTMHNVLLTGASGFLGVHLLEELVKHTQGNIYCLLRGEDEASAALAFKQKLQYYDLQHLSSHERVILILGDLSKPYIGLDDQTYKKLAKEVTDIYHNGALVHHIYDYLRLQKANVHSTIEILKLASAYKPKHIHYISTLSATMDHKYGQIVEDFVQAFPLGSEGGYTLSKWASEKILADAVARGFICTIHRLPQIMGHSVTGITPSDQIHITLLMKNWIELGIAPKDMGNFEFLPVDFTAKAITAICSDRKTMNKVYNFGHPTSIPFNQIVKWLNEFGYVIQLVEKEEWQQRCASHIQEDSALYSLLSLYLYTTDQVSLEAASAERTGFREDTVEMQLYLTTLAKKNISLPAMNKELFFRYCKHLQPWFTD